MVTPITRADTPAPIRIAHCCLDGVAPTRNPVFKSCDVVPPFEDAMHTTAATDSAVSIAPGPVRPRIRKIRHTNSRVAMVMPEIGFDDDPTSPVSRLDT